MTDRRVKVGVVGVGSLGQAHARIYSELSEAELVGVFDVDRKQAEKIATQYKTTPYTSIDELASKVEAVSVVVPTDLHRKVGGQLIEKGIHLLVEKPIAATTSEAEELVRLAQEKKIILQVGHVERFNPVLSFLDRIKTRPRFIEAHRLAPYPPPRAGLLPRGTEVSVVLDLMIHDLEVILHLVKSPVKDIRAVGVPVLSRSEDIANVRLLFESGCVANVTASRISPEKLRKIRVFFEDAYVSLDYQNQSGEIYRKGLLGISRDEIPIEKGEPLANELRSFVGCVAHRDEPVVSGEHAAEALKLAAEICQRVREGAS
ncbi:MAG TPA: oxidoreductase [Verrucomicrobia bacterium]|nr:MAG: oxidoreductase [Lentisphaerae bacterium GWF2_57_35]HBA85507.1 oxidoreductase [Verrucomicrobiota bacterium]